MTHEIHEHWSPTNNDDSTVINIIDFDTKFYESENLKWKVISIVDIQSCKGPAEIS